MVSDETIERAVEVVWECGPWTDQEALRIVRALAEAGLLAPAPLREEWAVEMPHTDAVFTPGDRMDVLTRDLDWPRKRRYVTDWEEA